MNTTSSTNIHLKEIVSAIKAEYKPNRLILYGSRANGTARPDSDYDFVMVLPEFDKKKRYGLMSDISSKFLKIFGVEVQVWTYSQADFDDWKDEFSSIPETALNTGKEIELG
jgi:predicted nucleotidyltransferase